MQLRELRKRSRISQEDLAFLCGISRTTLRRIEDGEVRPRRQTGLTLARVLRVPPRQMAEILTETYAAAHPEQEV